MNKQIFNNILYIELPEEAIKDMIAEQYHIPKQYISCSGAELQIPLQKEDNNG